MKKILIIIINIVIVLVMVFFSLLTPYADWDVELIYKQIDNDKLDVLRLVWISSLFFIVAMPVIFKQSSKKAILWYILLTGYSGCKVISLFLI